MNKLYLILKRFIDWVTGKSFAQPKHKLKLRKLIEASIIFGVISYCCLLGPLVPFMPFALGFRSISDGQNKVFYQAGDDTIAVQSLGFLASAQSTALRFWHNDNLIKYPSGMDIYICRNHSRFYHISMYSRGVAVSQGENIIIDLSKIENRLEAILRHEVSHNYTSHISGWGLLSKYFIPRWFDEGIATLIGDEERHTGNKLREYLEKSPEIISAECLSGGLEWENNWVNELEIKKRYAYAHALVSYLINNYGISKIKEYPEKLSVFHNSNEIFREIFGETLSDTERKWLSENKASNAIPLNTKLVRQSLALGTKIGIVGLYLIILYVGLWLVRQLSLGIRWTKRVRVKQ